MSLKATSWVKTHESGPKKAVPVLPVVASKIIKRAKRPVLVIGSAINDVDGVLDRVIKLKKIGIGIVATGHSIKFLAEKGVDAFQVGVVEITNMLTDSEWKGVDGKGAPDLVIVMGAHLDLMNQTFSTLKNFTDIDAMCLDRYFMVNAKYSFPNVKEDVWLEYLDELIKKLK